MSDKPDSVEQMSDNESDACPSTGEKNCTRCSGEYCNIHFYDPCECDAADRHRDLCSEPRCPCCDVAWREHLGMQATCAKLQAAEQRIDELTRELDALREQLARVTVERDHYDHLYSEVDRIVNAHLESVGRPLPKESSHGEAAAGLEDELRRMREEIA